MSIERDTRVRILNTLLTTPHRKLAEIHPVHQEMMEQDPRFYVHLAAWYFAKGEVRDHKDMFVVSLVRSDVALYRGVGLALLRRLPPHQVMRVVDFIKGSVSRRRRRIQDAARGRAARGRAQRRGAGAGAGGRGGQQAARRGGARGIIDRAREQQNRDGDDSDQAEAPTRYETVEEKVGLFENVPRSVKTEISRYLREREADADTFDNAVLHGRKALKRLYASLHIKPGERAQQVLFDDDPPEGSRLHALKQVRQAKTPRDQAKLIVQHRFPYRVAASVIRKMTPSVLVALIEVMTPQEVINNMGSLKRRGAFDNEDVQKLVRKKLQAAQSDNRVSAFKAKEAVKAADVSEELAAELDAVTDARVKAKGRIRRPTAVFIDKSSSMTEAIDLGKQLGAMISSIIDADLYVYAFDTAPYAIDVTGHSLKDWEQALQGIRAGGATSCGVALEWMRKKKQRVEQIVMITDEGENQSPLFVPTLERYMREYGDDIAVVIIRTRDASDHLERQLKGTAIDFDVFQFTGDYYALPNLLPLLMQPSRLERVMEIMEYPLPKRKEG